MLRGPWTGSGTKEILHKCVKKIFSYVTWWRFLPCLKQTAELDVPKINLQVDKAEPDFPRPAGFWWFGCSSIEQGIAFPSATVSDSNNHGGPFQTRTTATPTDPSMIIFGEGR